MKQLTCEVCGGTDLIKQDGVFVCQSCGCKYSADEVKKLMVQITEPVKVEGIQNGDDLFENISSFIKIGDYKNAAANIEKMKSIYPNNYKTWTAIIELAIHQMNSGKDIDVFEQDYSHLIEGDIEKALALCAAEKQIIQERFNNYCALVEENKRKKAEQKEKLFKDFEKGDYRSIHNFYYKRGLSSVESQMDRNLFRDGYIYIFKFDNDELYLLTYSIMGVGHAHPGPSYDSKIKVHIDKNGIVMSNNRPLKIHNKEYQIKDIVFENGFIDKIIMPELEFVKEPALNIQNDNVPNGGCFIATAVYGSYDCPEVWTLRRFRDNILAKSWYGRTFIRIYYAISPILVKWFGHTKWFKKLWKGKLDQLVDKLQLNGVENTPYSDQLLNTYR